MSRYIFDEDQFEYRGYIYCPYDDVEEDNCKRFHNVYVEYDGIRIDIGSVPLSPYCVLTFNRFKEWIQMGKPTREDMGGYQQEQHDEYYRKTFDKVWDHILLGGEVNE